MNTIFLEIAVLVLGLALLLVDLWTPAETKRWLGYGAALGLGILFCYSFKFGGNTSVVAFHHTYVLDGLALFFRHNYIPQPDTIYRNVQKLTPGTILTLRSHSDREARPQA